MGVPVRLSTVGPKSTKATKRSMVSPALAGAYFFHLSGKRTNKGTAHSAVQKGSLVPGHARSVIGVKENDRVFRQPVLFQLFEDVANLFVHGRHAVMEPGDGLAHDGRVRVVGGQGYLGRIMDLVGGKLGLNFLLKALVGPDHGPTLVGSHQVEDRKEGLFLGGEVRPLAPVGRARAFVPRALDYILIVPRIVIGFHVVGRVIAILAQESGESLHVRGQGGSPSASVGCRGTGDRIR